MQKGALKQNDTDGVISPNTFTSAAPQTYSIICISSESCLWSNVGFARLLCFGTLRSALSAKVALGELLRLCPSSAGLSTSVEKAKTDCHDKARDWSLFGEVFRVPKDLCRLGRGAGPVRLTACIVPRIRPSEYQGLHEIENSRILWLSESDKALLVRLPCSFC